MSTDRITDLEQQIAHLRWRRIQKERSIKNSLVTTKTLKQKDLVLSLSVDKPAERSFWTHSVVYDEVERPLVIDDAELYKIQEEEFRYKKILSQRADSHLKVVAKTKNALSQQVCHGEADQQLQLEKMTRLAALGKDINKYKKGVELAPPVIKVKTPIPRLFS